MLKYLGFSVNANCRFLWLFMLVSFHTTTPCMRDDFTGYSVCNLSKIKVRSISCVSAVMFFFVLGAFFDILIQDNKIGGGTLTGFKKDYLNEKDRRCIIWINSAAHWELLPTFLQLFNDAKVSEMNIVTQSDFYHNQNRSKLLNHYTSKFLSVPKISITTYNPLWAYLFGVESTLLPLIRPYDILFVITAYWERKEQIYELNKLHAAISENINAKSDDKKFHFWAVFHDEYIKNHDLIDGIRPIALSPLQTLYGDKKNNAILIVPTEAYFSRESDFMSDCSRKSRYKVSIQGGHARRDATLLLDLFKHKMFQEKNFSQIFTFRWYGSSSASKDYDLLKRYTSENKLNKLFDDPTIVDDYIFQKKMSEADLFFSLTSDKYSRYNSGKKFTSTFMGVETKVCLS